MTLSRKLLSCETVGISVISYTLECSSRLAHYSLSSLLFLHVAGSANSCCISLLYVWRQSTLAITHELDRFVDLVKPIIAVCFIYWPLLCDGMVSVSVTKCDVMEWLHIGAVKRLIVSPSSSSSSSSSSRPQSSRTFAPLHDLTTSYVHTTDGIVPTYSYMWCVEVLRGRAHGRFQPSSGFTTSKCSIISYTAVLAKTCASIHATCPKTPLTNAL